MKEKNQPTKNPQEVPWAVGCIVWLSPWFPDRWLLRELEPFHKGKNEEFWCVLPIAEERDTFGRLQKCPALNGCRRAGAGRLCLDPRVSRAGPAHGEPSWAVIQRSFPSGCTGRTQPGR